MTIGALVEGAPVDEQRRRFLVASTAVIGGIGVVGAAVPFVASWQPSAKAKAMGAPVKVDFSKLEPGQQMVVPWRGKPVFVVKRTPEVIAQLKDPKFRAQLRDPLSAETAQKPDFIKGELRSIDETLFVVIGICTHLGCVPDYKSEGIFPELAADKLEHYPGYLCPCHGSKFDLAGRVFKGVPAPLNLVVPPYQFLDDARIQIGV